MTCAGWMVGALLLLQVPPPLLENDAARELEERGARSPRARRPSSMNWQNDWPATERLRPPGRCGNAFHRRLHPMAQRDSCRCPIWSCLVPPARYRCRTVSRRSGAERPTCSSHWPSGAAKSDRPQYSLASVCLRAVLERNPEHKEARRLLGYVPYQGGWARPFAVAELRKGNVNHPTYGWVSSDWVPHLDRGELPAPFARGQKARWLPAEEADRLRAGWERPWKFATEHFEIRTNVPLNEAISFGRRLEAFHDLFMALLADILGEDLALVRRFKDPSLVGDGQPTAKLHQVYYFASKEEFVEKLRPLKGPEIADSLGFYDPPKSGHGREPAYFFRDPGGQIPVTATLYHEVSHQLLFETAGATLTPETSVTPGSSRAWVPTSKPFRRNPTAHSRSVA